MYTCACAGWRPISQAEMRELKQMVSGTRACTSLAAHTSSHAFAQSPTCIRHHTSAYVNIPYISMRHAREVCGHIYTYKYADTYIHWYEDT